MSNIDKEIRDAVTGLILASHRLNEIVEGVRCSRWADENQRRLKDTDEWVRFYVALQRAKDARDRFIAQQDN